MNHSYAVRTRKNIDGITLTDEQKAAFSKTRAAYSERDGGIMGPISQLHLHGTEAELKALKADAQKLLGNHYYLMPIQGGNDNYCMTVQVGTASKTLATILAKNEVPVSGVEALKQDGPSGARTL